MRLTNTNTRTHVDVGITIDRNYEENNLKTEAVTCERSFGYARFQNTQFSTRTARDFKKQKQKRDVC